MQPRIVPGAVAPGRRRHRRHLDGDGTAEFEAASEALHHMVLGPGDPAVSEWAAAGLELPDLEAIRVHRLARVRRQLDLMGYDGVVVMDPINIRYITDTTNMQVWVMHNAPRYAFMSADGYVVLWDYEGCEFLAGHHGHVDEVRTGIGTTFFLAGGRYAEQARRWADELSDVLHEHCGDRPRNAIDQVNHLEGSLLAARGITIERGQEVMELARVVKCPDEITALRCAGHACTATMAEMRERVRPGMTEQEVWAMLHEGNIRRGGEWIETQILASGPRTNPWFQEASSRVLENGDMLSYDTDLVGAYGMCVDISRSWVVGDRAPTAEQRDIHELARHQIAHNMELLQPGATMHDLTFGSWFPEREDYRHYSCLFHGVGQCDEYPEVFFPHLWDTNGYECTLEPGMVMSVEAFVGSRHGGEGVKLEEQVAITETGYELLADFPLEL